MLGSLYLKLNQLTNLPISIDDSRTPKSICTSTNLRDVAFDPSSGTIELQFNKNIVAFNPTLTSVVAGNTAVYLIGSRESGKATCSYLLKYLHKDPVEITNALSVAYLCSKTIERRPSQAADNGTTLRKTAYYSEVLLLQMNIR